MPTAPKAPNVRTKLIIRNLPPTLTEDAAIDALHAAIPPPSYNFIDYIPGKLSATTIRPSRLYINLVDPAYVHRVHAALHNKLFVSQRGTQFRAAVEYAPFQRTPGPGKPDKRTGTIESDNDYVALCARLAAPQPSAQVCFWGGGVSPCGCWTYKKTQHRSYTEPTPGARCGPPSS